MFDLLKHVGRRFGRLVVTRIGDLHGKNRYFWCRCSCGVEKQILRQDLEWGDTRSCGCLRVEKARSSDRDKAFTKKWLQYKHGSKVDGRVFRLTRDQFRRVISKPCYYCGVGGTPFNGIDRVDNSKGYIRTNCNPCCTTCNRAKLKMTQREFLQWVQRVFNHSIRVN
jgi:hypothetical protein